MLVVLFDIDGTLISTGGAGGTALMSAFRTQFAIAEPRAVPFSGRTDRGIAAELFLGHDIEDSDDHWQKLRAAYLAELPQQLPLHEGRILPGVAELLAELLGGTDILVGLLTGNMRNGARLKLAHFGLDSHFSLGGFGDLHRDRDSVARDALRSVVERTAGRHQRVVVIGDTPLDIRCARAIGAEAVAVTTGMHPRDELIAAVPDLLLSDLADTRAVRQWLMA